MKIAVLGFGSWAIALSLLFNKKGHSVTAWLRSPEKAEAIRHSRECPEYLPGVYIPEDIHVTTDISEAAAAEIVVFAVGSKSAREVAEQYKPFSSGAQILVNASKGLEPDTFLRLSEVLSSVMPDNPVAAISGPCHAEELSRGLMTTCVASSTRPGVAEAIQDAFMHPTFRIYTNQDIVGVELGGALKNVIALSTGIADGLGNGDNARAALITRGIVEITRLGVAMGANAQTFSGLTGIGDLIVTCTSQHSRNRRAGYLLGQGKSLPETLDDIHMLVEGVSTAKTAAALARKYGVSMPITDEVNKVLFEGKDPKYTVSALMEREKTTENKLYELA